MPINDDSYIKYLEDQQRKMRSRICSETGIECFCSTACLMQIANASPMQGTPTPPEEPTP